MLHTSSSADGIALAVESRLVSFGSSSSFGGWCEAPAVCEGLSDKGHALSLGCLESLQIPCDGNNVAANLAASSNIIDVLDVGGIDIRRDDDRSARGADCGVGSSSASSLLWWQPTDGSDRAQSCSELSSPVMTPTSTIGAQARKGASEHHHLSTASEEDVLCVGNLCVSDSLSSESVREHSLQKTCCIDGCSPREYRGSTQRVNSSATKLQEKVGRHVSTGYRKLDECCHSTGWERNQAGKGDGSEKANVLKTESGVGVTGLHACDDAGPPVTPKRPHVAKLREGTAWNPAFASLDLDFALGLSPGSNSTRQCPPMVGAECLSSDPALAPVATSGSDRCQLQGVGADLDVPDVDRSPAAPVLGSGGNRHGTSKTGCSVQAKTNSLAQPAEGSVESQILEKFANGPLGSGCWVGQ